MRRPVFFGTNGFDGYDWTAGSLLRQDWLVALVLGIAASRRGRPALAGALLGVATLLRIFPAFVIAALLFAYARRICLLAVTTQLLWFALPYADVKFVWMSVAELATVFAVTWYAGRRSQSDA